MRLKKTKIDPEEKARFLAKVKQEKDAKQSGYRERALAPFLHTCGRCGREFLGKNLAELTVHHKDNNHLNNPPYGSNWELLCVSCHDDVHQDGDRVNHFSGYAKGAVQDQSLGRNPFTGLKTATNRSTIPQLSFCNGKTVRCNPSRCRPWANRAS